MLDIYLNNELIYLNMNPYFVFLVHLTQCSSTKSTSLKLFLCKMWHHTCAKYRKMSLVNYSVEVSAHWQKWATAWLSAFQTEVVISFYFTDQITLKIKTKLSDYLFRWSHYETTEKVQRCILLNLFVLIYKTNQQPSCLHSKKNLLDLFHVPVCKCAQSAAFVTYTLGHKSRFASYTFAISDALIIFQLHITLNF